MGETKRKPSAKSSCLAVMHVLGSTARTLHDGVQTLLSRIEEQTKCDAGPHIASKKIHLVKPVIRNQNKVATTIEESAPLSVSQNTTLPSQEAPSFKEASEKIQKKDDLQKGKSLKKAISIKPAVSIQKKNMTVAKESKSLLGAADAVLPGRDEPSLHKPVSLKTFPDKSSKKIADEPKRPLAKARAKKTLPKNKQSTEISSAIEEKHSPLSEEPLAHNSELPEKSTASIRNKENLPVLTETVFSLSAPDAKKVHVVGDFNDWKLEDSSQMDKNKGKWTKKLKLPHGRYLYRFVVDGKWIEDPKNKNRVKNPYGQMDSLLEIK